MTDLNALRRASTHDERQVMALEMIADQLCLISEALAQPQKPVHEASPDKLGITSSNGDP